MHKCLSATHDLELINNCGALQTQNTINTSNTDIHKTKLLSLNQFQTQLKRKIEPLI